MATNPGAGVSVIHLMKTEQFLMDNAYYPPVGGVGVRLTRSVDWGEASLRRIDAARA